MLTGISISAVVLDYISFYDKKVEMKRIMNSLKSIDVAGFNPSPAELEHAVNKISDMVEEQFDRTKLPKEEREALMVVDRLKGINKGDSMTCTIDMIMTDGSTIRIDWTSTITYD
jgi:hypothetical protein